MAAIHRKVLDAIVLLYNPEKGSIGTGFVTSRATAKEELILTAAHVIEGNQEGGPEGRIEIVFQSTLPGSAHRLLSEGRRWILHPEREKRPNALDTDIAMYRLRQWEKDTLTQEGVRWASIPGEWGADRQTMDEEGIWEGNPVLTYGYPGFVRSQEQEWMVEMLRGNVPYTRGGTLAQVQPMLRGATNTFTIDCPAYEGQSGSPLLTYPTYLNSQGTERYQDRARLIGMLVATKKAPILTIQNDGVPIGQVYENAGLGVCVGMDEIWKTVEKPEW